MGGAVAIKQGGTGARTAAGARQSLGAASSFSFTITGDGTTLSFPITHNLNTLDYVDVLKDSSGLKWFVDVIPNGLNACNVVFSVNSIPAKGQVLRGVLVG